MMDSQEMVTVLRMNLHCDACSEEIKRRILKITGTGRCMHVREISPKLLLIAIYSNKEDS